MTEHKKPPFCWCHDDEIPNDILNESQPDAAPQEPQAGETYVSSWGELLYLMTRGEMGTKPPLQPRTFHTPR